MKLFTILKIQNRKHFKIIKLIVVFMVSGSIWNHQNMLQATFLFNLAIKTSTPFENEKVDFQIFFISQSCHNDILIGFFVMVVWCGFVHSTR